MLGKFVSKSFEIGTKPARFALNQAALQVQRIREMQNDFLEVKDQLAGAQSDMEAVLHGIFATAGQQLSELPGNMTDKQRESEAISSLHKAEQLMAGAAVELIKGLALLVTTKAEIPEASGNVIDAKADRQ